MGRPYHGGEEATIERRKALIVAKRLQEAYLRRLKVTWTSSKNNFKGTIVARGCSIRKISDEGKILISVPANTHGNIRKYMRNTSPSNLEVEWGIPEEAPNA